MGGIGEAVDSWEEVEIAPDTVEAVSVLFPLQSKKEFRHVLSVMFASDSRVILPSPCGVIDPKANREPSVWVERCDS